MTPAPPHRSVIFENRWQRWSTEMHLVVTDADALSAARREVDAELDAVEVAASRFRPDSEINRLSTSNGQPTPISEVLAELLTAALGAARQTDGDVDPTMGAALIALGYDDAFAALSDTCRRVSSVTVPARWSMVTLDGTLVRVPPGVVLDLGATAKAIAADNAARRAHHATGAGTLVNLGGDIATAGPAPDSGWAVLVQDTDDDPAAHIALSPGTALATSSTTRRRWRSHGQMVHHIVDPRTGQPARPVWRTVTVAADTCLAANTACTAAVIRGRRAPEWLAGLGLPARLVDQHRDVQCVGAWPADDTRRAQ